MLEMFIDRLETGISLLDLAPMLCCRDEASLVSVSITYCFSTSLPLASTKGRNLSAADNSDNSDTLN